MIFKAVNIFIFIFLLLVYSLGLIKDAYDETYFNILFFVNVMSIISFNLVPEKYKELKKQKIKLSLFFLISFIIVHFQAYLDILLGYLDVDFQLFWISRDKILKGFLYSSLGLNAFFVGSIIYSTKRIKNLSTKKIKVSTKPLRVINLVLFLLFLTQIDAAFLDSQQYNDRVSKPFLGMSMLFYETSFFALLAYIAKNKTDEKGIKSFFLKMPTNFAVLGIYLLLILISGDRGPVIYLSLGVMCTFVLTTQFKWSGVRFYSIILAGALLLSLIGALRKSTTDIGGNLSETYYNRYYPESSIIFTKELAGSIRTVNIAVNEVPKNTEYFKGFFMLQNISLVVPGLNGFVNRTYGIDSEYLTSAKFLTYVDLGSDATWGVGTSAIADVYLDFGAWGIVIVFLLFGVLVRKLEVDILVLEKTNTVLLILYLLYFAFSIYISRSNIMVPFTKLPYVLLFYYFPFILKKQKL